MTITAKNLVAGVALTNALVTEYTSPTNVTTVIKAATACNTSAGTVKLTINIVRSGGAAGVLNTAISAMSIAAGITYNCPELINKVLGPGDFIQAKDDTGAVTALIVDGIQIS